MGTVVGRMEITKPFKPTGMGGGSKKGKPQNYWPLFYFVAGDAILLDYHVTIQSILASKETIPTKLFKEHIEHLLPGAIDWFETNKPNPTISNPYRLCKNRIYVGYRPLKNGRRIPIKTIGPEHWSHKVPYNHPFHELHRKIVSGEIRHIPDWKTQFGVDRYGPDDYFLLQLPPEFNLV